MRSGHARESASPAVNEPVAAMLDDVGNLLEEQGANQYRVQAWRGGAATLRRIATPVATLLHEDGIDGLDRLPGIGPALARAIAEIVETGRLRTLERLRGEHEPGSALATVPGVGAALAERVHDVLGIESLEELEQAAHDGRLATVPGFGAKRIDGIADALATRLRARRRSEIIAGARPPLGELLDVDREYRERAERGTLPTIAPRRFNPTHERWLPVLHTSRAGGHYTALFSNTATAHRAGRTQDWVVVYHDGRDGEQRATVVTARNGPLAGRRVVRGREPECMAHYHVASAA